MKYRPSILVYLVVLAGGLLGLSTLRVSAVNWTPPTASPPYLNIAAPINVSGSQVKLGSLTLSDFYLVPSAALDVAKSIMRADSTGLLTWGNISSLNRVVTYDSPYCTIAESPYGDSVAAGKGTLVNLMFGSGSNAINICGGWGGCEIRAWSRSSTGAFEGLRSNGYYRELQRQYPATSPPSFVFDSVEQSEVRTNGTTIAKHGDGVPIKIFSQINSTYNCVLYDEYSPRGSPNPHNYFILSNETVSSSRICGVKICEAI